jgi:hypothetical protein
VGQSLLALGRISDREVELHFFYELVVEHLLLYISIAKSVHLSSQTDLFHIINSSPLLNNNGTKSLSKTKEGGNGSGRIDRES